MVSIVCWSVYGYLNIYIYTGKKRKYVEQAQSMEGTEQEEELMSANRYLVVYVSAFALDRVIYAC